MKLVSQIEIKQIAKLKQKKFRKEEQLVIIEGKRLLEQVISNGIVPKKIYALENSEFSFPINEISWIKQHQLDKLSSTKTPQKIIGIVPTTNVIFKNNRILLYLDGISEPGNMGTIFRTATAAGIDGIVLSEDCCEIWNPKVVRASLGTVFSLPSKIRSHKWLFSQKSKIISSSLNHSQNLFQSILPKENCILVVGSEADGVSKEVINHTDEFIHIPMTDKIESLNVGIAAGLIMFHYTNQLR